MTKAKGSVNLKITMKAVNNLKPYAANARTHSDKQIAQIAASIKAFGFNNPVLLDDDGGIIAGHGRLLAAKSLGLSQVPTIQLSHLSDAQKRAYILADNRLAEKSGWDNDILAIELGELSKFDLDFDLEITGFEMSEIDLLIGDTITEQDTENTTDVEVPNIPVSKRGDLWLLGEHRLLCGDALNQTDIDRLMSGAKARTVFSDPPYNVPINGHVCGLGKIKHREFKQASGEMSASEFTSFLVKSFDCTKSAMTDGGLAYICMDWRHVGEIITSGMSVFDEYKNLCIWTKSNGGMGSFYRSAHELVFVFKAGDKPHINNVQLGKFGRYRTNVWPYAGVNSFGASRSELLSIHPTVKPTALVADAILDSSKRGDNILDTFVGSGTTLLACERTGRKGFGLELDPLYVDAAILRWQKLTGQNAILESTGEPYSKMREHLDAQEVA